MKDVGAGGNLESFIDILFDKQNSDSPSIDLLYNLENVRDQFWAQSQRRLIQYQQRRVGHKSPCNGQFLLLSATECIGALPLPFLQYGKQIEDALQMLFDVSLGPDGIGP